MKLRFDDGQGGVRVMEIDNSETRFSEPLEQRHLTRGFGLRVDPVGYYHRSHVCPVTRQAANLRNCMWSHHRR